MKKLISDLSVPAAIVAMLIITLSASFKTDDIITNYKEQYIETLNRNNYINYVIMIIDAGHGGTDGGAVSVTGGKESEINLSIARKTEQLAAFFGIDTVMTRESEDIDYPDNCDTIHKKKVYDTKCRVELINSYENAVVISIHQNNFNEESVNGAQVFYRSSDDSLILSENITAMLQEFALPVRLPSQISDSIYIFKNIMCPAVMLECGFLSNHEENALLQDNCYQNKLAASIIVGFLNSYGGTNENQNDILLY